MTKSTPADRAFLRGEMNGGIDEETLRPTGDDSWRVIDLGSGIRMLEVDGGNPGGNLGLLLGEDGSVLIDNGLEKAGQMTLATTEKLVDGPVKFVINTHLHADHLACNPNYAAAGATIIAHENTRRTLLEDENYDRTGLPVLTFNDTATFHLSGQTIVLSHIPLAHTHSDIIVHFTEANVIHAGDMFFNKVFPFIDLNHGGNIDGFIAGQRRILEIANDETRIIPGHGPLGNRTDLQAAVDMLVEVQVSMRPLIDQGLSMEEVLQREPLAPFADWAWFHISIERMTKVIYCLMTA